MKLVATKTLCIAAFVSFLALQSMPATAVTGPDTVPNSELGEFRGKIVYKGTYSMREELPGSRNQRGNNRMGALQPPRAAEIRTRDYSGEITFELTFDRNTITGVYYARGLQPGSFSGVLSDGNCEGTETGGGNTGQLLAQCDHSVFNGTTTSVPGSRQMNVMTFEAAAADVVDFVERDRQRAVATEQRQAAAIAARVLPAPDLAPIETAAKSTRALSVRMSQIDDSGFVLIGNPGKPLKFGAGVEWESGNPGALSQAITNQLEVGDNFVVFGLHNKAFQFGPGRWSFRFELNGEGGSIWSNSGGAAGGGVGIRYWKPFIVTKQRNGSLTVKTASAEQTAGITSKMKAFNEDLIQNHGTETSSMGLAVGAAIGVMADSLKSPARGSDSFENCMWYERKNNPNGGADPKNCQR